MVHADAGVCSPRVTKVGSVGLGAVKEFAECGPTVNVPVGPDRPALLDVYANKPDRGDGVVARRTRTWLSATVSARTALAPAHSCNHCKLCHCGTQVLRGLG